MGFPVASSRPGPASKVPRQNAQHKRVAASRATEEDHPEPQWCVATVTQHEAGLLTVCSGTLTFCAQRAASCLLVPEVGDEVACLRAGKRAWVTAVLHRETDTERVLSCTGNTRLQVKEGVLAMDAQQLELNANALRARTDRLTWSADSADVVGNEVNLVVSRLKVVGALLATVFDGVRHFSKSHRRRTEGMDQVSATHVERRADQLMQIEGDHVLVTGRDLVKARGAQIHFG